MIPLDWILANNDPIPDGLGFIQTHDGWMLTMKGWYPLEMADSWLLFQVSENYRDFLKMQRGY